MSQPSPDQEFERRWRSRFEYFGSEYTDEALVAGWSRNGLATRLRRFARLVNGVSGNWVDVGCGAGTYVRQLNALGASSVCGVDYSVPSLVLSERLAGGGQWVAADGRNLPFVDGTWDGVISFGVTQALASSADLVSELTRVAAPGGQIWVDGLNRHGLPRLAESLLRRESRVRYENPSYVAALLRASGCTDVTIHWVIILPGRLCRWQIGVERLGLHRIPLLGRLLAHAFIVTGRRSGG